jgi:hypothetical protein
MREPAQPPPEFQDLIMATPVPSNRVRPVRAQGAGRRSAARNGSDRWRAVFAVLALAALLGAGLFAGSNFPSPVRTTRADAERGRHLASSPVVFVPRFGNRCRQRTIDNATWRMRDVGEVDCDGALSQSEAIRHEGAPSRVDGVKEESQKK